MLGTTHGPKKVLILEDDRRTMFSLISAAIPRNDRLEILWARTLEEAIDALDFYHDRLAFIVLGDAITDGPTIDFAKKVEAADYHGTRINIALTPGISAQLEAAGFHQLCARIELPSCLLNLVTSQCVRSLVAPPT